MIKEQRIEKITADFIYRKKYVKKKLASRSINHQNLRRAEAPDSCVVIYTIEHNLRASSPFGGRAQLSRLPSRATPARAFHDIP